MQARIHIGLSLERVAQQLSHRSRVKEGLKLKQRLKDFFKESEEPLRCVALGEKDAEWHHVNFDKSHTVFANLIPLSSKLNLNLRDAVSSEAGSKHHFTFDPALQPKTLISRAEYLFLASERASDAYGCARLATYVGWALNEPPDKLVEHATKALYYARHCLQAELLQDILEWDIYPLLANAQFRWHPSILRRILQECANIYAEFGRPKEARAVYSKVIKLWADSSGHTSPSEHASFLRRQAIVLRANDEPFSEVDPMFTEALSADKGNQNLEAGIEIARAWHFLCDNQDRNKALDITNRLVAEFVPPIENGRCILTPRNIAELLSLDTVLRKITGARSKGIEDVNRENAFKWAFRRGALQLSPESRVDWKEYLHKMDERSRSLIDKHLPPEELPEGLKAALEKVVNRVILQP